MRQFGAAFQPLQLEFFTKGLNLLSVAWRDEFAVKVVYRFDYELMPEMTMRGRLFDASNHAIVLFVVELLRERRPLFQ